MYMKQQFHPLLLVQSNIIKNKTHTPFIIHMTNVDCIKIGDPKILFMVVALVNQNMIEKYQNAGVKYLFQPVGLISIKHLINQQTSAAHTNN